MAALYDVNVWVALAFDGHPFHQPAMESFNSYNQRTVSCSTRNQRGFLTTLSSPVVTEGFGQKSLSNLEAWNFYLQFMEDDRINFIEDPEGISAPW